MATGAPGDAAGTEPAARIAPIWVFAVVAGWGLISLVVLLIMIGRQ
ncbi:MAG: hypothetical protein ACJ747_01280 [Gaiellaceae bacterium]|jgi:hypothetical protein